MQIRHAELGELEWDADGWWQGAVTIDGEDLAFAIGGDAKAPDPALVKALVATLKQGEDVIAAAKDFVVAAAKKNRTRVDPDELEAMSIAYLWSAKSFVIELELAGDEDAIWRVEFEDGVPKQIGRDD